MAFYGCFVGALLIWRPIMRNCADKKKIILASILGCVLTLQMGAFSVTVETMLSDVTELPFVSYNIQKLFETALPALSGLTTEKSPECNICWYLECMSCLSHPHRHYSDIVSFLPLHICFHRPFGRGLQFFIRAETAPCTYTLQEDIPVRVDLCLLCRNPPLVDKLLYDSLVMRQLNDPALCDPVDPGVPYVDTFLIRACTRLTVVSPLMQ